MKGIWVFAVLALLAQGCEKPCNVPAGDYRMHFKSLKGDCDPGVVKQFEDFTDIVPIPEERACQRFVTQISSDVETCRITMDVSAQADSTGLHDGQGVFTMLCDGGDKCRQTFAVTFEKIKKP